MSQRRGFWTERRRRSPEDARLLAAERLDSLRAMSYEELVARAARDTEVESVTGLSGETYRRRTSVKRMGSGEREQLRIIVSVDAGTLRGRLDPLAEELVIATPDGEMVGEYTLASEGNDPRRYRFPGGSERGRSRRQPASSPASAGVSRRPPESASGASDGRRERASSIATRLPCPSSTVSGRSSSAGSRSVI